MQTDNNFKKSSERKNLKGTEGINTQIKIW